MRADQLLVEQGLAPTRSAAQRLITAGVEWCVGTAANWQPVTKNGQDLPGVALLRLLDAAQLRYVSRAGLKLEGALQALDWNPKGLRFLDVGQSTGGFTDCLLQHGADHVVGLDVGHGQLATTLQTHAQVTAIEGVNARDAAVVTQSLQANAPLWITDGFDGLVMDVSFISQTLVLPAVLPWVKPGGYVLTLVKPQFELSSGQLGKGGLVTDPALYPLVQQRIGTALQQLGCQALRWLDSPILGGDGNREFFVGARAPS